MKLEKINKIKLLRIVIMSLYTISLLSAMLGIITSTIIDNYEIFFAIAIITSALAGITSVIHTNMKVRAIGDMLVKLKVQRRK